MLDVGSVAGHLPVFALLAEHRDQLFPAALFADLFPSVRVGPPRAGDRLGDRAPGAVWPSDREAVDALTFDLRWKAACGYAIDAKGFDPLDVDLAAPTGGQRPSAADLRGVVRR